MFKIGGCHDNVLRGWIISIMATWLLHQRHLLHVVIALLFLCRNNLGLAKMVDGTVECRVFSEESQAFLDAPKRNNLVITAFTASSCSHCNRTNMVYKEFSKLLGESNITRVKFFAVDMDSKHCADVSKDFDVNSLPAVIVLQKGQKFRYYSGPVEALALLSYSFKISQSSFSTFTSMATFLDFANTRDVVVAGFFRGNGDKDELADFRSSSKLMQLRHNVYFAMLTSPAAISNSIDIQMIKSSPSACIFNNINVPIQMRDWHKTKTSCTTLSDLDGSLANWIGPNALRLVDEVTSENSLFYEDAKLPMMLMFMNATNDNSVLLHEFEMAAENLRGKALFAWSNDADSPAKKVALGVPAHVSPALAVNTWSGETNQYVFPPSQHLNARNIENWVRSYLSGQVKPKVVVNSAPPIDFGGFVQSLTFSKFNIVYDTAVDAVVLFFSHMQRQETEIIALQFKRAAERLRSVGVKTMTLYAYDVETNPSLPKNVDFHKLPSICIIPASKKAPPFTYYNGKGKGDYIHPITHR
jgi:thiol-disulfide isomerase/thioredoxin